MSKGKEFFEYCIANPDVLAKLKGMKNEDMAEYVKAQGFELGQNDMRDFMEQCAESNDEDLAAVVSGGMCSGHCGRRCEGNDGNCRINCELDVA